MLIGLEIKNMALIENASIEFNKGLTVLSGETGAGKSILIDSINFALGAKVSKELIREGADYAYATLVFKIENENLKKNIESLDFNLEEDNLLIITRKLSHTRTSIKVNDEIITAAKLSKLSKLLIDIHGQHEHQSLFSLSKQLDMLDSLMNEEELMLKKEYENLYNEYIQIKQKINEHSDEYIREREIDILKYEIREIESSRYKPDEEEKLNTAYRRLKSVSNIAQTLSYVYDELSELNISGIIPEIRKISDFDTKIKKFEEKLYDIENDLLTLNSDLLEYIETLEFDEDRFIKIEKRLDFVNSFTNKYTSDYDELIKILNIKKKRLKELLVYSKNKNLYLEELKKIEDSLNYKGSQLRVIRFKLAEKLKENIVNNLKELNFLDVKFEILFKELNIFNKRGLDEIEFLISTNPGNPPKPLKEIASGGELSRIMLAFKSLIADMDETPSLIFDEIDTGISGITATKVAQKLAIISKKHQVLCITHLAGIAAMADNNYLIEKSTNGIETKTNISDIRGDNLVNELARLLGGSTVTEAVLSTAKEMKNLADEYKKS